MLRSLLSYHPRIGHTYTPSVKSRVPFGSSGYLVRTNAAGFRSEREFTRERPPGVVRAILFGDSMTAGDGVANSQRFSDLSEKAVPGLEVFNYAVSGTGTDQQYLTYLDCANVEHDLVILAVYVANLSRVNARFRTYLGEDGEEVFYPKPYYELHKNELRLCNVPVPKRPLTMQTLPSEEKPHLNRGNDLRLFTGLKTSLLRHCFWPTRQLLNLAIRLGVRDLLDKMTGLKRLPGYDAPDNPDWVLVRRILETWIEQSSSPVLLVPIPMWPHIEGVSDPSDYQARFQELATKTGCRLHDPLPDLAAYTPEERRNFRFMYDGHFTPTAHQAIARSLTPTLQHILQENKSSLAGTGA